MNRKWKSALLHLSFCRPRPDEPDHLRATVPQKTVKLGEILSEDIGEYEPDYRPWSHKNHGAFLHGWTRNDEQCFLHLDLELADQYGNSTKTLTPNVVNHITVNAVGLDKSSVTLNWQVRIKILACRKKFDFKFRDLLSFEPCPPQLSHLKSKP